LNRNGGFRSKTLALHINHCRCEVGGFGTLLVFGFDYKDKPEAWHYSLRLLKHEVLPRLKHLDTGLGMALVMALVMGNGSSVVYNRLQQACREARPVGVALVTFAPGALGLRPDVRT
jgi:hypothetical protein